MKAFKSIAKLSSMRHQRADEINVNLNWKEKSGRLEGPDTYVHGDFISSVFRSNASLSPVQREEIYGGSVLLIGLLDATDVLSADSNGLSDPYLSLTTMLDGKPVDKIRSRTVDETLNPLFDEILTVKNLDIDTLAFKLRDYDNPLKSDELGYFSITLDEIKKHTLKGATWEKSFPLKTLPGMPKEATGSVRLRFYLHHISLSLTPSYVSVSILRAENLLIADSSGYSDPYVKVRLVDTRHQQILTERGEKLENRTEIVKQSLNPVWNEQFAYVDCMSEEASNLSDYPEIVSPNLSGSGGLFSNSGPVATACALSRSVGLQLILKDWDFGKSDDDLGSFLVPWTLLLGDDATVRSANALRTRRWFNVRPHKSMSSSMVGLLGRVLLDISLVFPEDVLLAPEGWTEAVDAESGDDYWYCASTGASIWTYPGEDGLVEVFADASSPPAPTREPDAPHKPPRPLARSDEVEVDENGNILGVSAPSATSSDNNNSRNSLRLGDEDRLGSARTPVTSARANRVRAASKTLETLKELDSIEVSPPQPPKAEPVLEEVEKVEEAQVNVPIETMAEDKSDSVTVAEPPESTLNKKEKEKDDEDGSDDELPVGASLEAINAAASFGGAKKASAVASYENEAVRADLAGVTDHNDREKAFFESMRKQAEKKREEQRRLEEQKLAAMTPEERKAYEEDLKAEKKREERKNRIINNQMSSFSSGAGAAAAATLRGRGRGRGRGRA